MTLITGSGRDHPTIRNVLFVVGYYVKKLGDSSTFKSRDFY